MILFSFVFQSWQVVSASASFCVDMSPEQSWFLRFQVCMAAEMYAFPECRYVENGWQISTVAPNKGLADQVKKLILQTSSHVPGSPSQSRPFFHTWLRAQ